MQMIDRLQNLEKDFGAFFLTQSSLGLDVRTQVAAIEAFHDEMHAFGGLYCFVHSRDARV